MTERAETELAKFLRRHQIVPPSSSLTSTRTFLARVAKTDLCQEFFRHQIMKLKQEHGRRLNASQSAEMAGYLEFMNRYDQAR